LRLSLKLAAAQAERGKKVGIVHIPFASLRGSLGQDGIIQTFNGNFRRLRGSIKLRY
jgi:hypothetical protein